MITTLRPECPSDELFLRRLILETVAAELGASHWPEPMRSQLLEVQYRARRQARAAGESFIIEAEENGTVDAGWLVLTRTPEETRIVDIMTLPALRGRGIGSAAICCVLDAADHPVRLSVNALNHDAIRLYERLGFRRVGQDEVQYVMEHSREGIQG